MKDMTEAEVQRLERNIKVFALGAIIGGVALIAWMVSQLI